MFACRVWPRITAIIGFTHTHGRPHRQQVARCKAVAELLPYSHRGVTETVVARTSIGFIDSVTEVFGGLAAGASVMLCPEEWGDHPIAVLALCDATTTPTRITVVPTMLKAMLDAVEGMRGKTFSHGSTGTQGLKGDGLTSGATSLTATPSLSVRNLHSSSTLGHTLRTVVCSGAPLRRRTVARFYRVFDADDRNVDATAAVLANL